MDRRSENEIDNLIMALHETESGNDALPKHGILSLISPIKRELKAAQYITLRVRRRFLYSLLKNDQEMYNKELSELGKTVWKRTA